MYTKLNVFEIKSIVCGMIALSVGSADMLLDAIGLYKNMAHRLRRVAHY